MSAVAEFRPCECYPVQDPEFLHSIVTGETDDRGNGLRSEATLSNVCGLGARSLYCEFLLTFHVLFR